MSVDNIVDQLGLQPHPEGGYFKEVYRSDGSIPSDALGDGFDGPRNYATSIYFLLTSENFSAFHRIGQDEIWHFYTGSPLFIHVIDHQGRYQRQAVGLNLTEGQLPQFVVPAGSWFASSVAQPNSHSLVGCTVSPGFDFKDFELARREDLSKMYPEHQEVIKSLTRE